MMREFSDGRLGLQLVCFLNRFRFSSRTVPLKRSRIPFDAMPRHGPGIDEVVCLDDRRNISVNDRACATDEKISPVEIRVGSDAA
jgi:hypothetical protein